VGLCRGKGAVAVGFFGSDHGKKLLVFSLKFSGKAEEVPSDR